MGKRKKNGLKSGENKGKCRKTSGKNVKMMSKMRETWKNISKREILWNAQKYENW
jgi:hypothetical protein